MKQETKKIENLLGLLRMGHCDVALNFLPYLKCYGAAVLLSSLCLNKQCMILTYRQTYRATTIEVLADLKSKLFASSFQTKVELQLNYRQTTYQTDIGCRAASSWIKHIEELLFIQTLL